MSAKPYPCVVASCSTKSSRVGNWTVDEKKQKRLNPLPVRCSDEPKRNDSIIREDDLNVSIVMGWVFFAASVNFFTFLALDTCLQLIIFTLLL